MRGLILFFIAPFVFLSEASAEDMLLTRLERGDLQSSRVGSTVYFQGLIRKSFQDIKTLFASDLNSFTKRLPEVAFIKPFKSADNRALLYFKIRGLLDGSSFLVEIKEARGEALVAFNNLILNSSTLPLWATEMSQNNVLIPAANPWLQSLQQEIGQTNSVNQVQRVLGGPSKEMVFTLDGPLNPSMSLAGVRFQLRCDLRAYSISRLGGVQPDLISDFISKSNGNNGGVEWTYFSAQLSFSPETPSQELGDYRGFRERQLAATEWGGSNFLRDLRSALESF